jgi:hypothetical protein
MFECSTPRLVHRFATEKNPVEEKRWDPGKCVQPEEEDPALA